MEKLKKYLISGLLTFALISIGFALGKNSMNSERNAPSLFESNEHLVAVYYLHSSFRCVTCNTIEKMTLELLNTTYSRQLADGRIKWIEDDFQKNESLAHRFEVVASCVVVAEIKEGKIKGYKRLDEVWTLIQKPKEFNLYLSNTIDTFLKKTGNAT